MPSIVQWILGGLVWAGSSLFGKLFMGLGLAFVIQEFVLPDWVSWIAGLFSGAPSFVLCFLGMMRLDDAITVILSAIAYKYGMGMISGIARVTGIGGGV